MALHSEDFLDKGIALGLLLLIDDLLQRRVAGILLDLIGGQVWCFAAFCILVLMTTLVYYTPIAVTRMPDFRTVKASAFAADQFCRKNIHATIAAFL